MDAKELKAALKSAREAIRNKDFKEALKVCQGILKTDKNNYNALVFVGVAAEGLQQGDQAVAAYRKAIEVDETQPLAWQGLCSFYEKSGGADHQGELCNIYEKLLQLYASDAVKVSDVRNKLSKLYSSQGQYVQAIELYKVLLQESSDASVEEQIWTQLVVCLEAVKQPNLDMQQTLLTGYKKMLASESTDKSLHGQWLHSSIQLMIKLSEPVDEIGRVAREMLNKDPASSLAAQILCRITLDECVGSWTVNADLEDKVEKLSESAGSESCISLVLARAFQKLQQSLPSQAVPLLNQCVSEVGSQLSVWVLLAVTQVRLHDSQAAVKSADQGLSLVEKETCEYFGDLETAKTRLMLCKAQGLSGLRIPTSWQQSVDTCQQLVDKKVLVKEAQLCMAQTYIQQAEIEKAKQLAGEMVKGGEKDRGFYIQGRLQFLAGDLEQAKTSLSEAINLEPETASYHYWLSRVYWAVYTPESLNKLLAVLLKAAKLDPYFSETFLYLGHYYEKCIKDQGKASRCYQKAYDLDPDHHEAGSSLVDSLVAMGKHEEARTVLLSVTSKASGSSEKRWAWLRLGLSHLECNDPNAAITCLQSVLRADPHDHHIWECLGEAYLKRGSFTAALKAFTKAQQLSPDSMYCSYQLASIKQSLGQMPEAVQEYQTLLKTSPDYVPALKGLGESLLHLGSQAVTKAIPGAVLKTSQEAIQALTRAASFRPDMSCLWKLLGDACTVIHTVPTQLVKLSVPGKLVSADSQEETKELNKTELLALGARCYGMAIKQCPATASFWHDLGVNYFHQACHVDGVLTRTYVSRAMETLQKAVTMDPANHRHWTALGVTAASKHVNHPGLAQHCFIKSIQAEPNNVVAWTNLGALYMSKTNIEAAHEAFKIAQSLEPSYVACWIGQALIAETVGHEDAMDLFRHTTELTIHVESCLGYGHWVTSTVLDKSKMKQDHYKYAIKTMGAINAASDALSHYTDVVTHDATAYNLFGVLLERQGLKKMALKAYQRAVELLSNVKGSDEKHLEKARLNYARLLLKTGDFAEAASQYKACRSINTWSVLCCLGLALYKMGEYIDCYKVYEQAADLCDNDTDKSEILTAISMVAYKAGDLEGAKSTLFKSSQCPSPSAVGLKALCALGLELQDGTLTGAVLEELARLEPSQTLSADLCTLTACLLKSQGDVTKGYREFERVCHTHPDWPKVGMAMCRYLLHHMPQNSRAAATVCQTTMETETHFSKDMACWLGLASLAAGHHSPRQTRYNAFRLAQKAVHLHPDCLDAWIGMFASTQAESKIRQAMGNDNNRGPSLMSTSMSMAAQLLANLEKRLGEGDTSDRSRLQTTYLWCVKHYVLALLSSGRQDQAVQFLQKACWMYEEDPFLQGLSAAMQKNFRTINKIGPADLSGYVYQVLGSLYRGCDLADEAEFAYKQQLKHGRDKQVKLAALVMLAHLAFKQTMVSGESLERWMNLFNEADSEVEKLAPPSVEVIHLLQAIIQLHSDNPRLARRILTNVMQTENTAGCLGYTMSLVRINLLGVLMQKNETEKIQVVIEDALENGDHKTLKYYEDTTK